MAIIDRGITRSHRKSKKLISLFLMIILALSLITISFLKLQESEPDQLESPTPARISYNTHAPIYIDGNGNFTNASGVVWGSGTESDPYIIEDWDINASSVTGIRILNTDAHFIIKDCYIHDSGERLSGIHLYDCVNGVLSNNTCNSNNYSSIRLSSSSNNTLSDNTCNWNSGRGIDLDSSSNNTLSYNTCNSNNKYGIYLNASSNNNIIWNNTFIGNNGAGSTYNPNNIQAYDDGTNNWWNSSGYGNNWSDWQSPDLNFDGIVDNPYDIDGSANAKDYYPYAGYVGIPEPSIFILAGIMIAISLIFGRARKKR